MFASHHFSVLVEPALCVLRKNSGGAISPVLQRARQALASAEAQLAASGSDLHVPSFELGAVGALCEMLGTAWQRTQFSDALQAVESVNRGVDTLHELAIINRSSEEATQSVLAERIGADRGNFNRRISRLEELGLVASRRQGRTRAYSLTALGMDLLSELRPGWRSIKPESADRIGSEAESREVASGLIAKISGELSNRIEREVVRDFELVLQASTTSIALRSGAGWMRKAWHSETEIRDDLEAA